MLITAEEFASIYPDISKGWRRDQSKIERCIETAERVDLFDVLGSFYFDVLENKDDAQWSDLMSGTAFEYKGEKSMHIGIKKYLAGLAYVRYLTLTNVHHTPFGVVNKMSQDSEAVDAATLRDIKKTEQRTLEIEFDRVNKYLLSLPELFTNYRTGNNPDISFGSVKTSTLR